MKIVNHFFDRFSDGLYVFSKQSLNSQQKKVFLIALPIISLAIGCYFYFSYFKSKTVKQISLNQQLDLEEEEVVQKAVQDFKKNVSKDFQKLQSESLKLTFNDAFVLNMMKQKHHEDLWKKSLDAYSSKLAKLRKGMSNG